MFWPRKKGKVEKKSIVQYGFFEKFKQSRNKNIRIIPNIDEGKKPNSTKLKKQTAQN